MLRRWLAALLVTLLTAPSGAQSLGEAAAREREKREQRAPSSSRVFTGDDLKKGAPPKPAKQARSEDAASAGEAAASSSESEEGEESPSDARGESDWRHRAQERRDAIAAAEQSIQSSQDRLARLMADREPVGLFDPNRLQTIESLKAETRRALEAAQRDLADAQQALRDFEEEARRNSVPPGWLR